MYIDMTLLLTCLRSSLYFYFPSLMRIGRRERMVVLHVCLMRFELNLQEKKIRKQGIISDQ
jgi:hypothetical protein